MTDPMTKDELIRLAERVEGLSARLRELANDLSVSEIWPEHIATVNEAITVLDQETGWLIELPDWGDKPLNYWSGYYGHGGLHGGESRWTENPNLAVRFARKQDAKRASELMEPPFCSMIRIHDHAWVGIPR